jgi:spermidine/putrescine transport system substrate-binding protein
MRHPKDRGPRYRGISRREFLRRSAGTAAAFSSVGAFLAACKASNPNASSGPSGKASASKLPFPLARRDSPVTWPVTDDTPPIDSDLEPEKDATLKVYNWDAYIWKKLGKDFGEQFNCNVEFSIFDNIDQALAKIRTGQVDFDVYFPDPSFLGRLIYGKLIRPLNLDYIPNLKNCWPQLQDPFYDRGSHYTVPYVIYSTGIGWRNDHVSEDPYRMDNPYDLYWNAKYKGKVNLLDDVREAVSMALLRNGITDVNTEDPKDIGIARDDLKELVDLVAVKIDVNDYTTLPEGSSFIHQAWSGDLISAQYYLPKGTPITTLSYWYPPDGKGPIGSDNMAILKGGKNPVLAHHFLNFMLDKKNAYANFANFVGYQPPQNDIDADRLVTDQVIPKNLTSCVVRESDFDVGFSELELSPDGDALWHSAFQELQAGD